MVHSLAFATWADTIHELLMVHLHIRDLCAIVTHYAMGFLGERLHTIPNATSSDCVAAPLFGDRTVTAHGCQLYVYGAFDGSCLTLTGHTADIFEISVQGDRIASCSGDCTVRVWDSQSGECVQRLTHPDWVIDVIQLELGEIVTCCNDYFIRSWRDGECIFQSVQNAMLLVPLSRSKFVSCSFDDHLHVWDRAASPCHAARVDKGLVLITHMVVLEDGNFATHDSECIFIWSESECVRKIECRTTELCALGKSYLAAGGPDGTVCVWNTLTGECLWTLVGHTAIVWSMSAMPDQKLASGSADCTVRIWDLTTGLCVHVLPHPTCVRAFVVLEHTLVSLGIDQTMCVWE